MFIICVWWGKTDLETIILYKMLSAEGRCLYVSENIYKSSIYLSVFCLYPCNSVPFLMIHILSSVKKELTCDICVLIVDVATETDKLIKTHVLLISLANQIYLYCSIIKNQRDWSRL